MPSFCGLVWRRLPLLHSLKFVPTLEAALCLDSSWLAHISPQSPSPRNQDDDNDDDNDNDNDDDDDDDSDDGDSHKRSTLSPPLSHSLYTHGLPPLLSSSSGLFIEHLRTRLIRPLRNTQDNVVQEPPMISTQDTPHRVPRALAQRFSNRDQITLVKSPSIH